jgi:CheY-like chemotaxis protein
MILMVDDERRQMDSHYLELRYSGYDVEYFTGVDDALRALEARGDQVDLLILDIMMPPGAAFKDADTKQGLRTGVRFFERVRADRPNLPVIIFTNVSPNRLEERFKRERACRLLQKEDYLPFELAEEVEKMIGKPRTQQPQQPNSGGEAP